MKNRRIILIAILLIVFSCMLTSCRFFDMNPIVTTIIDNASDDTCLINATITLETDTYTYDGTAFSPAVTKVVIGEVEIAKENYTVSYANNTNAGTATVTVTAAGETFTGSKSTTFTINPKALAQVSATVVASYIYTGTGIIPDIKDVKCGQVALTANDYDLAYENNINVGNETATCTVTGKGNYTGSASFKFSITPLSITGATITLSREVYQYTGEAFQPTVIKITTNGIDYFIPASDYDIVYQSNTEIGDATVTITGKTANCTGQTSTTFTITGQTVIELSFNDVEGETFESIFKLSGEKIQKPADPTVAGKEDSTINWYTQNTYALGSRFFFDEMPANDFELYGRWEEEISSTFFAYPNATPDLSIDSFTELVDLFEYICFNQIDTAEEQAEFYTLNYSYSDYAAELSAAWNAVTYPTTTGYGYSGSLGEKYTFKIYLSSQGACVFEPTITADTPTATQFDSFNNISITPERAVDYNDFYIETLTTSYEVESSNQLFYVLERGLKPNPIVDSTALTIYNEAKNVLRQIINDDMSDYDKAVAIYQWIANTVTYDYGVGSIPDNQWINYNDFYLEGVFIDQVAVCDGISKAYVVLCQMEGIPCIRVTGYTDGDPSSGHAWNKVKIDGQWFVVDPTWGNTGINSNANEFLNYQHFMTSDQDKVDYGCTTTNYLNSGVASTGDNRYYENCGFTYQATTYDFVIESQAELNILMQYCASFGDIADYTVNFYVIFDYGTDLSGELGTALTTALINPSSAGRIESSDEIGIITVVFS